MQEGEFIEVLLEPLQGLYKRLVVIFSLPPSEHYPLQTVHPFSQDFL